MSVFILIWACASVALIALAIRNEANKALILSDIFWLAVLCPVVICIWIARRSNIYGSKVVWRRK